MNYKMKKALKNSRKAIILVIILWILGSIVLVSPMATSAVDATVNRSVRFWKICREYVFRLIRYRG